MVNYRFLILNAVVLLVLLGSHYGRRIESAHVNQTDFLKTLSIPFRGWKTTDVVLQKSDLDMLQPDAALVRRYNAPEGGGNAEIAIIAGHRKKSVHTPGFCMVGDGWEVLEQYPMDLHLSGRTIPATRSLMVKDKSKLVITYFFTDGDYCTNSLLKFQGAQLMRRFNSKVPIGALVRTIVIAGASTREAEELSDDFARSTVPIVLQRLQQVKVQVD